MLEVQEGLREGRVLLLDVDKLHYAYYYTIMLYNWIYTLHTRVAVFSA